MRLTKDEQKIIKSVISEIFGESKIYLFGSRLDMSKKGRDIDLFVVAKNEKNLYEKKLKAAVKLERLLYKPVDIVVHRDFNRNIEKEALKGILL